MRGADTGWRHLRHAIAVLAGFLVFVLIYSATGDSELLVAISSGLAGSLLVYLGARLAGHASGPK